jgi:serine/threonine-protein kinase
MAVANSVNPVPGGMPAYIGRYRVIERIGKGAMGMVYAADDETMGRRVAIKVMMADLEEEPETRERFYREAKVTGQLIHPNIVTVFDLGEDHGRPYIVMELLQGTPLGEHLQRPDARTLDAKLDLMMQICDGLHAAHEKSVIHRDVKPSNLFVQPDGTLKILDFGIARLATSTLTASGFLVGTPEYMSPEQAIGTLVDERSDVFSAASVFYFMVTGRAPFGQTDLPKVLIAVMHSPPAAITEHEAPESLSRVLMKALNKNPDQRYQGCAHIRAEIGQIRRMHDDDRHRIARAALDRYRQIEALIEERRVLGRRLQIADIDPLCDEATARLAQRFPDFARHATDAALMAPLDRDTASAALTELQARHNAELAAVDVLRAADGDRGSARASLRDRAATLLDRLRADGGHSKGSL